MIYDKKCTYIDIDTHVTVQYSGQLLMKPEFSRQNFLKSPIRFHENSPVGAESFHEDERIDGQTNMTTLTVAFHNFAQAPKNSTFSTQTLLTFTALASYRLGR